MSSTARHRAAVVEDDLQERGFELDEVEGATVASGGPTALAGVDAPLAVVALPNGNPLTVVSAIANAAHEGHVPVLVADSRTETDVEPILAEPFLLRGRQASGRLFYPVEDRILLSDDSYACTPESGAFEWVEEGVATDDPPLVLRVGGETVATLESTGELACPGPSASTFRYSYARGDDGWFRVLDDDEAVGRYTGVSAMRADGFRPVPLPLVPEHHVRDHGRLARATLAASVGTDDHDVAYRSIRP